MIDRHLELIFPFITFQILSFSSFEVTGNCVNIKVFKEFSLPLSRDPFLCEPSVLLLASSCLVNKMGNSFNTHLQGFVSRRIASWTPCTLLGVTQFRISSSPTLLGLLGRGSCTAGLLLRGNCTVGLLEGGSCIAGERQGMSSSPHRVAVNALASMVQRSLVLCGVRGTSCRIDRSFSEAKSSGLGI